MSLTPEQKDTIREEWETEEWGGWKIVSDMLDNPDEFGIYPTSKCYKALYDFVVAQKDQAYQQGAKDKVEEVVEKLKEYVVFSTDLGLKVVYLKDITNLLKDNT